MKLDIIQEPDERLHEVAVEVHASTVGEQELLTQILKDMDDTFYATDNCIGLAAPQLGIPYRIIIVDVTDSHSDTYLMINPMIIKQSEEQQRVDDGCMSVRNGALRKVTQRPKRISVTWVDARGVECKQKFSGTIAACIHHEIDHLNGVLFMERAV